MTMLTSSWKVFICDDQPALRRALTDVIASLDGFHAVGEASGGDECIARLPIVRPDLLILDVNMPQGGPGVARTARKILPELRIVVYTAVRDPAVEAGMREAGALDYVVKTGRLKPLREALYRVVSADLTQG